MSSLTKRRTRTHRDNREQTRKRPRGHRAGVTSLRLTNEHLQSRFLLLDHDFAGHAHRAVDGAVVLERSLRGERAGERALILQ
jgi:hypothetical protein